MPPASSVLPEQGREIPDGERRDPKASSPLMCSTCGSHGKEGREHCRGEMCALLLGQQGLMNRLDLKRGWCNAPNCVPLSNCRA